MRQKNLETKIFLDSGDPAETKELLDTMGFLDGQTTNPTLVAKNPHAKERFDKGEKFSPEEILEFYKKVVTDVSILIPNGSVSIEVYADASTTADHMFEQAQRMFTWIPNAHIKFPTTEAGLTAAERAIKEGMRVNMTLVFTQAQAAAVYAATKGARRGDVFVSPFVGRLDDREENGMSLIENIMKMYGDGDGHVEVLTASVRSMEHFLYALKLKSHIITAPFKIIKDWYEQGMAIPGAEYSYDRGKMKNIPFEELDLGKEWNTFDISHDLTDSGLKRFSEDWNAIIS